MMDKSKEQKWLCSFLVTELCINTAVKRRVLNIKRVHKRFSKYMSGFLKSRVLKLFCCIKLLNCILLLHSTGKHCHWLCVKALTGILAYLRRRWLKFHILKVR